MSIIETMKTEIERLKEIGGIVPLDNREQKTGYESALIDIETFLESLESEKPMEGLEEELDRIVKCEKEFMNFQCKSQLIGYVARHFAKWGAEHLKK